MYSLQTNKLLVKEPIKKETWYVLYLWINSWNYKERERETKKALRLLLSCGGSGSNLSNIEPKTRFYLFFNSVRE